MTWGESWLKLKCEMRQHHPMIYGAPSLDWRPGLPRRRDCWAGFTQFAVASSGEVLPCDRHPLESAVGNIARDSLPTLLRRLSERNSGPEVDCRLRRGAAQG